MVSSFWSNDLLFECFSSPPRNVFNQARLWRSHRLYRHHDENNKYLFHLQAQHGHCTHSRGGFVHSWDGCDSCCLSCPSLASLPKKRWRAHNWQSDVCVAYCLQFCSQSCKNHLSSPTHTALQGQVGFRHIDRKLLSILTHRLYTKLDLIVFPACIIIIIT